MLCLAAVGSAAPAWVRGLQEVTLVDPAAVEAGLNAALARTAAPLILPVQAEDQFRADALLRLARALSQAPRSFRCAAGTVEQVRRDGTVRRVAAAPLAGSQAVLAALRLPTPVLFRTAALREAGGWRPGEANWQHRSGRHRALLARLLGGGALLPVHEHLGTAARVAGTEGTSTALSEVLRQFLLKQVTLEGPGFRASGRLTALTPHLATLVGGEAPVTLIPLERITTVQRLP